MSVGDVAVSQKDPNLVWVGTGEGNNRQSTSWGDGVFKSTDGGKTWKNMGLAQSYHINRIVIDPNDNNIVFVAAQGPLFGPGGDRGVYKTTDGGATWKQVLKVDDDTGANDLVMDATNNQILYASTYQRRRTACCMNGGGPGSGIWKSTDGGDTWTRLTGRPADRIARPHRPRRLSPQREHRLRVDRSGRAGPAAAVAAAAVGWRRRGRARQRPRRAGGGDSGVYRTDDGGASWHKTCNNNNRPMYFSQIRVDPNNPDRVITGGLRMTISIDGGKTFENVDTNEHDDKHATLVGSEQLGSHADRHRRRRLHVVGHGAQLRSSSRTSRSASSTTWASTSSSRTTCAAACRTTTTGAGRAPCARAAASRTIEWQSVQGGDGFVAIIDPRDSQIVYSETQDGNIAAQEQGDRRVEEHPAERAEHRRSEPKRLPLQLGHADGVLAERSRRAVHRRQQGVPVDRSRRFVDGDQPGPDDECESQRHRDDGREGQRHPHRQGRRHPGVADDHLVQRVAEAARPVLRRHG